MPDMSGTSGIGGTSDTSETSAATGDERTGDERTGGDLASAVPGRLARFATLPTVGPLAALLLACVFFSLRTDRFLTGGNLSLVVQQVMEVGTLDIGQPAVILTAGIDLSNGALMAFGTI